MWTKIKKLILILILANILFIFWGKFFNPPITLTQIGGLLEYGKLKRDYVAFDEMGTHVKKAVLAAEDQKFFDHNGFDYQAIQKAYDKNQKGKNCAAAVRFLSRRQKMFFFGRAEAGSAKVWRLFIPLLLN